MMMFNSSSDDEIKVFDCDHYGTEYNERLSPIIREEEQVIDLCTAATTANDGTPPLPPFQPYFISPYYSMVSSGTERMIYFDVSL